MFSLHKDFPYAMNTLDLPKLVQGLYHLALSIKLPPG